MRKTIDLNRAAATAEAKAFEAAMKTSDGDQPSQGPRIGAEDFAATGMKSPSN